MHIFPLNVWRTCDYDLYLRKKKVLVGACTITVEFKVMKRIGGHCLNYVTE